MGAIALAAPVWAGGAPDGGDVPAPAPVSAGGVLDACTLLKSSEIELVQGEPVREAKSSRPEGSPLVASRCFYALSTFARSVSLEVISSDRAHAGADGPREWWMGRFHGEGDGDAEPEHEAGKEPEPTRIDSLGEEAFWVPSRVGGTLHVLQKNACLRIAIGGLDSQPERLRKSVVLARIALERLASPGPDGAGRRTPGRLSF